MQMIEDCQNIAEATNTCNTMLADYVQRVRQSKADSDLSPQIRNACDYISLHIREKLTLDVLASQAGYTEYYFSHKFKQEMGGERGGLHPAGKGPPSKTPAVRDEDEHPGNQR